MKSLNFSQSGMTNIRDNTGAWLRGDLPLPDFYYIGKICRNGHGVDDKCVRYVKGSSCIICELEKKNRAKNKRLSVNVKENEAHKKAMDLYEDKLYGGDDPFDF